jgi:predicted TIM-barrel fold metal-dependent hydrolase
MLDERTGFESGVSADAGLIVDRVAEDIASAGLPAGLMIISADNHVEITEDIFHEAASAEEKAGAPRVWLDKYWRVGFKDEVEAYPIGFDIDAALSRSVLVDGFDFGVRNAHLDAEGIAKEIAYPQSLLSFIRYPDTAMQERMYRTYNDYVARLQRDNPGRFYPVGVCGNWWDPARAEASIGQIVDLGLKSFMVPIKPGKSVDGTAITYAGPEMDAFWAAAEASGLPVNFHIGEIPAQGTRGAFGSFFLVQAEPFRQILGNLIFGGILDRHPKLRIVFAEAGINWVAGALQDAELTYDVHRELFDYVPKHRPSHYWHQHCYATFQTDAVGLRLIDQIGADRVMWAQDYPHSEGTFGFTARAAKAIVDAVGEGDARRILGQTAIEVYGLE